MAATTATRSGSAPRRGEAGMAAEAGADMMQSMSRLIYSGSYALAYGIAYATVFVVQLLPQDNSVVHGFHDGGKAAMDELTQSLFTRTAATAIPAI